MGRILEVIFRRFWRLLLLIVLLPIIGVAVAYILPVSYQASASLWALRPYVSISASGPDTSGTAATPAQTQVTALSELLQTRAFALSVANGTGVEDMLHLDSKVKANFQQRDDALFSEISRHTQVTAQSDNLFVISYTGRDPKVVQQVVVSVIQNYAKQSQKFNVVEAQNLLKSYQAQLATARQNENTAVAAETQYIQTHPNLSQTQLQTDPQYLQLHARTTETTTTVQNLQTTIDSLNQQLGGQNSNSLFYVQDAPIVPNQPVSHMSLLLLAGGIGLAVALLACTLYIIIVVRRDHAVYTALDLQKVTFIPVIMQLPHLSSKAVPLLINEVES